MYSRAPFSAKPSDKNKQWTLSIVLNMCACVYANSNEHGSRISLIHILIWYLRTRCENARCAIIMTIHAPLTFERSAYCSCMLFGIAICRTHREWNIYRLIYIHVCSRECRICLPLEFQGGNSIVTLCHLIYIMHMYVHMYSPARATHASSYYYARKCEVTNGNIVITAHHHARAGFFVYAQLSI